MAVDPVRQAIIVGLTRYPRLELLGRYAGAAAGAFLLGYAARYVVEKGYYVPSKDTVSLVVQVLVGIALSSIATKLGLTQLANSQQTVIANTIEAAATNQVPEAIAAKATPSQIARIESSPATIVAAPPMTPAKS